MAQPTVTSISFDKTSYEPGDTVTATVVYTSSNEHGGDGLVSYSLGVSLTDELTAATNSGLSGQSAEFFVNSGPVTPNQVDIAAAAGLVVPGLTVGSLAGGAESGITSITTVSVTVVDGAQLVLWLSVYSGSIVTVSGLGLTWTENQALAIPSGQLSAWTTSVSSGTSGVVSVTFDSLTYVAWDLDQITGQNLSVPFVAPAITGTGSGAASSLTFGTPADSANLLLYGTAVLFGGYAPTATEAPAWTQLSNGVALAPPPASVPIAAIETQISPNLSSLIASANGASYPSVTPSWGAIGLEINAFQSGTGFAPGPWTLAYNDLAPDGTGTAVFEATAR